MTDKTNHERTTHLFYLGAANMFLSGDDKSPEALATLLMRADARGASREDETREQLDEEVVSVDAAIAAALVRRGWRFEAGTRDRVEDWRFVHPETRETLTWLDAIRAQQTREREKRERASADEGDKDRGGESGA